MSREHQVAGATAPDRTTETVATPARHAPLTQPGGPPPGFLAPGGNQAMAGLLDPPTGRELLEAARFNDRWMSFWSRYVYDWLATKLPLAPAVGLMPEDHENWAAAIWRYQRQSGHPATGRIDDSLVAEVVVALLAAGDSSTAYSVLSAYHQDIPFLALNPIKDPDTLRAARERADGPYFITGWGEGGDLAATVNRLPQFRYEVDDFLAEARGLAVDWQLEMPVGLDVAQAGVRNAYYLCDRMAEDAAATYLGIPARGPREHLEALVRAIAARQVAGGREVTGVVDEQIALGISLLLFQQGMPYAAYPVLCAMAGIRDSFVLWTRQEPPPEGVRAADGQGEWFTKFVTPDGARYYWCPRRPTTTAEIEALYAELFLLANTAI